MNIKINKIHCFECDPKIIPLLIEGIKELAQIVNKQNEIIEELRIDLQNKL